MGHMSDLKDRLRSDLTDSIKARDALRSSTLRMVLSAVTNAEVAGKQARVLTDDDVTGVLTAEAKKRRESATVYADAGRPELASTEASEAGVIEAYLPQQLGADELEALVAEVLAEGGFTAKAQMGAAMKAVGARVAGRADGGAVSALVRSRLA